MARPRKFNVDDVLEKAMMCFWEKGYGGASVSELERATGISRISLYNTFTDKEKLFIDVQNKYHQIAEGHLTELFNDQADLQVLTSFFEMIGNKVAEDTSPAIYGCMMVNTVLNVDSISKSVVDNVKKYRMMMIGLFERLLKSLQNRQEIRSDLDVGDAACYLLGSMWGALAVNRLYADPSQTRPQINIVIQTIQSWKQ